MKKWLACFSALVLLLALMPTGMVSAAETLTTDDGFHYRVIDGEAVLCGYVYETETLVLPDTIDGYPVTEIFPMSFRGSRILRSVTIPASIRSIGDAAFADCEALEEVTVEGPVTEIPTLTFRGCHSLHTITLPATMKLIKELAFRDCPSLRTVFFGGEDRNAVTIQLGNEALSAAVWYERATARRISGPWVYAAHTDGTASIVGYTGAEAEATVPSALDGYAVTAVGDRAFYQNRTLRSLTVPPSVTALGHRALAGCTSLTALSLPDTVATIGADAFSNCTSLTEFRFPTALSHLSDGLFANCTSLTAITVPDTVTSMGTEVFFGCDALRTVTLSASIPLIGASAFENCTALRAVTLPDKLEEIGTAAFYGCTALETIALPDSTVVIKKRAFADCASLRSVRFSEQLLLIETEAFAACASLRHVELPAWLYILGDGAFRDCTALQSAVLPRHLDVLRLQTFQRCRSLRRITLPPTLQTIEWSAFEGCSALRDVVIPASVTSIEGQAFYGTEALETVYYGGDEASWSALAAGSTPYPPYLDHATVRFRAAPTAFSDMTEEAWYIAAADHASVRGWISGFGDGRFGGAEVMQRQDLVLILARIAEVDLTAYAGQTGGLKDVAADGYYAAAVAWGAENEILTGYRDGRFGVGDAITREQLCTVLYRAAGAPPIDEAEETLAAFPDGETVSDFATEAMAWAVREGIVNGMENGKLAPVAAASRAQVATILLRAV